MAKTIDLCQLSHCDLVFRAPHICPVCASNHSLSMFSKKEFFKVK